MYGVVEISGHQYKVQPGDLIDVQKLDAEEGSTIELDSVLLTAGEKVAVGTPKVEGAKVTAKVLNHGKDRKIIVFKRKPGLWRKKNGHRQQYTALLITEVAGAGEVAKIDPKSKAAQKYLK